MVPSPISEIDALVGRRLSTVRQIRGLEVEELATQLSLTALELTDTEAGFRRFGPSLLVCACRLLDVPIGYFFDACDIFEGGVKFGTMRKQAQGDKH
jgi:transcriptional regulator with XRE-family HTH domain